jgi:hypothetical protein
MAECRIPDRAEVILMGSAVLPAKHGGKGATICSLNRAAGSCLELQVFSDCTAPTGRSLIGSHPQLIDKDDPAPCGNYWLPALPRLLL